ncbi:MAG: hypothetical protein D3910_20565 [Candidatus Electrothrix sp. ATG2]|nr:hypothetical protein [Candidatus Electrothrix sp. ATG2]
MPYIPRTAFLLSVSLINPVSFFQLIQLPIISCKGNLLSVVTLPSKMGCRWRSFEEFHCAARKLRFSGNSSRSQYIDITKKLDFVVGMCLYGENMIVPLFSTAFMMTQLSELINMLLYR